MSSADPALPSSAEPGQTPTRFLANVLAFGRLLRRAGIPISISQTRTVIEAMEHLPLRQRDSFRHAARTVWVQSHDQLAIFDRLFELFWRRGASRPRSEIELGRIVRRIADRQERKIARQGEEPDDAHAPEIEAEIVETVVEHSDAEALRQKDFARLTDTELEQVKQMLVTMPLRLPPRRTRRRAPHSRGNTIDLRRTLRRALRHGGEPVVLERRQLKLRPRPLVVLCDISGSMEIYSRIFLQFVYGLRTATPALEAFVFGTRLTRITRELRSRDVDRALAEAAAKVIDWGGGTRIGEAFHTFARDWGRRVLGGGAVVLVVSDAWDRGDPDLLGRETARLSRSCSRLIWLDPLLGSEGFEPVASGIRSVLPHTDDYLPVHDLRSLEQLTRVLAELRS